MTPLQKTLEFIEEETKDLSIEEYRQYLIDLVNELDILIENANSDLL